MAVHRLAPLGVAVIVCVLRMPVSAETEPPAVAALPPSETISQETQAFAAELARTGALEFRADEDPLSQPQIPVHVPAVEEQEAPMVAIPLPSAFWAGLSLLGGLGAVGLMKRTLRRL